MLAITLLHGTACKTSESTPSTTPEPVSLTAAEPGQEEPAAQPPKNATLSNEELDAMCSHAAMWQVLLDDLEALRADSPHASFRDTPIQNGDYTPTYKWLQIAHKITITSRSQPDPCPPRKRCFQVRSKSYDAPDSLVIHIASHQEPDKGSAVFDEFKEHSTRHALGAVTLDLHVSGGVDAPVEEIAQSLTRQLATRHRELTPCHGHPINSERDTQ